MPFSARDTGDLQDLTAATITPVNITSPLEIFKIEVEALAQTTQNGTLVDIYDQYAGDAVTNTLLHGDCPSDHTVVVVPEFPSLLALLFLVIVGLPVAIFAKKKKTPLSTLARQ